MKTQQLNTVFTGNAGQMMGEVQRFSGAVQNAMGSIFARAQAIMNVANVAGMRPMAVQAANRVEAVTNIPGYSNAVAQMAHFRMQGANLDTEAATRLGADMKAFGAADDVTRFEMIAERLSKIKDKNKRWQAAVNTGLNSNVLLARAGNYDANPELAASTRDKALANAGTDEDSARLARGGTHLGNVWGYIAGAGFKAVARYGKSVDPTGTPGFIEQIAGNARLAGEMHRAGWGSGFTTLDAPSHAEVLHLIEQHLAKIHENTK